MKRENKLRLAGAVVAGLFLLSGGVSRADDGDPVVDEKPVSHWLKQLRSENRGFQLRAAQALAAAPTNLHAQIAPKIIPVLRSERENDKFVGAQVLGSYGSAARSAVSDLLPMLEGTQYERNRAAAAKALGLILKDAEASEEVEKVTQALARRINEDIDKYSDVRREAARALGVIGPAAKSCIPRLLKALTDIDPVHGNTDETRAVRAAAAWTCGRMGPLAAEHVDRLISMMHAEGDWVPETVEALGMIGPVQPNIVPNILDKLERLDGNLNARYHLRQKGFEALARFGPKAAPAVEFLNRFLKRDAAGWGEVEITDAIAAIRTIAAIGQAAARALPTVESLADSKKLPHPRYTALREEAAKTAAALKGQTAIQSKNRGDDKGT